MTFLFGKFGFECIFFLLTTAGFFFGDIFGCFFLEILVEHQNLVEFLVKKKNCGGKIFAYKVIVTKKYFHQICFFPQKYVLEISFFGAVVENVHITKKNLKLNGLEKLHFLLER